MSEKFVKGEELKKPSRYMQNTIEAWDFAIQSLLPYPLGVVSKYVIRHRHKGGKQDLQKALIWAKKAKESYKYLRVTVPSNGDYFNLVPEVKASNFPDLNVLERGILKDLQYATAYIEGEENFNRIMDSIIQNLESLIGE